MSRKLHKYLRSNTMPHLFCSGCGHGILMSAVLRAIDELEIPMEECVFVSGIGCAGWIPSPHFRADSLHVMHGRPIPFAIGIKKANPSLRVIVISGDGDLASIGTNHLIHAARRNVEITVICGNNQVYAMTGGQISPTTPMGAILENAVTGNVEPPLDVCKVVIAAGAPYAARFSVAQPKELTRAIKAAIMAKSFAFVEAITICPTEYGRRNNMAYPPDMLKSLKLNCVPGDLALSQPQRGISDRITVGEHAKRKGQLNKA